MDVDIQNHEFEECGRKLRRAVFQEVFIRLAIFGRVSPNLDNARCKFAQPLFSFGFNLACVLRPTLRFQALEIGIRQLQVGFWMKERYFPTGSGIYVLP